LSIAFLLSCVLTNTAVQYTVATNLSVKKQRRDDEFNLIHTVTPPIRRDRIVATASAVLIGH